MHTQTVPDSDYKAALEWTDPSNFTLPSPGSDEEERMLQPITNLFSDYTHGNLSQNVTEVYAEKVYFRDAFKQLGTSSEIRDYLLHGLQSLNACEFKLHRIARSENNFFIDWTMRLDFKSTPEGSWEESIGMTKIRFNSEGRVIFHQDYWDPTDIVYRRIPIAKQLINYVKKKM